MTFKKRSLSDNLEIASVLKMPVIIHSRNAFRECVKIIDESDFDWNKVVFHCFSESTKEIMEINHRNGWVSFTGILTYKANEHLREALRATDLDRLMLETDSPYLAPIPKEEKKMNHPTFRIWGPLPLKPLDSTSRSLQIRFLKILLCSTIAIRIQTLQINYVENYP